MTISSLCNIALDFLFICIFNMGIAGAALGTILSECLVMIICGYNVYKIRKDYKSQNSVPKESAMWPVPLLICPVI